MDICILILSFQVIGNFDVFCDPLRLDEISDSVTADFLQPDRKRHQGALKDPEVEGLIFFKWSRWHFNAQGLQNTSSEPEVLLPTSSSMAPSLSSSFECSDVIDLLFDLETESPL